MSRDASDPHGGACARSDRPFRLLIAGGGTGGHVYPALAVADEVRAADPGAQILFLGTSRGLEARVVPAQGFALRLVAARGFPRRPSPGAVSSLAAIVRGIAQTVALVRRERPDALLGTGGYVSAPLVLAGGLLRRPVVIQEQNAIPGLANRLLGRLAREIHVAFPAARGAFGGGDRVRMSGNPLRRGITSGDRARAAERFGLDAARTTVLVFGGSLGARRLNVAVAGAAARLAAQPAVEAQFLVQTGDAMCAEVDAACRAAGLAARVVGYIEHMADAYALADLVVCRAGAMTLAELTACGRPAVLVPYPFAAHGHQAANAAWLAEQGAALVVADHEWTAERMNETVRALLADPVRRADMAARARALAHPEAAAELARALYRVAGRPVPAALRPQGAPAPEVGAGGPR